MKLEILIAILVGVIIEKTLYSIYKKKMKRYGEVVMAYERDHTHILVKDPIKFRKAYIEETYEESGKAYIKKDPQAQVFEL